jgi:hypothetical protein
LGCSTRGKKLYLFNGKITFKRTFFKRKAMTGICKRRPSEKYLDLKLSGTSTISSRVTSGKLQHTGHIARRTDGKGIEIYDGKSRRKQTHGRLTRGCEGDNEKSFVQTQNNGCNWMKVVNDRCNWMKVVKDRRNWMKVV